MGLLSTIGAASGRAFGLTRVGAAIRDAYFNLTTLLLPGNGTNGAQNNTFLDSSSNNFTITRNGNTTQGTFSPFSQTGWSNYFNGTNSDGIEIPNNAAFNFGTGDVTIEAWVYLNSTSAIQNLIDCGPTGGSGFTSWVFDMTASGFIRMNCYVSGNYQAIEATSNALSPNQWNHVAFTRASGTNRLFVNGALCTATGTFTQAIDSGGYTVIVGRGKYVGFTRPSTGYFSNVRITKGGALYTAAFTPSTTPLTTTVSAGTVSLLTCQSNRFIDNSVNAFAITVLATPSVQAFSPFAPTAAYSAATVGGSGYFDGSGDNLSTPSITIGTNTFCFECWLYPTVSQGTAATIFAGNNNSSLQLSFFGNSLGIAERGVAWQVTGTATVPIAAWSHVAFVRSGTGTNQTSIYLNGTRIANGTVSLSYVASIYQFSGTNGGGAEYQGYMSGVRFSNGSTPYDATQSTITIPTAPPSSTGSTLCLQFTNAGITDATAKNDLETVGNAQISTTQSKFGGSSMYFDGTGDWLLLPASPNMAMGTGDFTFECWIYATAASDQPIYECRSTTSNTDGFTVTAFSSTVIRVYTNAVLVTATVSNYLNTWTHVAFTRAGSTNRLFINGTLQNTATASDNFSSQVAVVGGGRYGSNNIDKSFTGYIDDLRITKGYARYTASFTAPTAAFALQ